MFSHEFFQLLVFSVFIFTLIAYATLDGFDLGVGSLFPFARDERERRLMINAIGPVWDGNTTWIVIGGGILFAAFPRVFATLASGLYTPFMLLIFGFMMRGVAIEFRGKRPGKIWRKLWDIAFIVASLTLAFTVGIVLGNWIEGLPFNNKGEIEISLGRLFRPYPSLVALFGLSIFMTHGSIYLLMKTEGEFQQRLRNWTKRLIPIALTLWAATTLCTFLYNRHMVRPFLQHPWLSLFVLISLVALFAIPFAIGRKNYGWAFVASSLSIVSLFMLFTIGTFPYFIYSTTDPAHSLTVFNSSSSQLTLGVLTLISLTGIPLSFFYAAHVYKVFRGKVKLDPMSY